MHPTTLNPDFVLNNSSLAGLHYFDEVGSTNDVAKQLFRNDPAIALPTMVIAETQTNGRGRSGKTWWSAPGSIAVTLLIGDSGFEQQGLIACAAALGVADAIQVHAQELNVQIKWPNDVYINKKKVAGLLIEKLTISNSTAFAMGIGVNLNCDFEKAPDDLGDSAGSISQISNQPIDPNQFLCSLVSELHGHLSQLFSDPSACLSNYTERILFPPESHILVSLPYGDHVSGAYGGIGKHGQLLLANGERKIEVDSGTIDQFSFQ